MVRLCLVGVALCVVAVEPALAQDNPLCQVQRLDQMIEGFFQLTTSFGVLMVVVGLQIVELARIFGLDPDTIAWLRRKRSEILRGGAIILLLGPVYTVAGEVMGLPLAECINLVP